MQKLNWEKNDDNNNIINIKKGEKRNGKRKGQINIKERAK